MSGMGKNMPYYCENDGCGKRNLRENQTNRLVRRYGEVTMCLNCYYNKKHE